MKNILLTTLSISFLFLSNYSFSQNLRWSLRADAGISKIPLINKRNGTNVFINFPSEEGTWAFSSSYGSQIEYKIRKNLFLNLGLTFSTLKDKTSYVVSLTDISGMIVGGTVRTTNTLKSSNFNIPVSLKFKVKKTGFYLGIQSTYLLESEMTISQTPTGIAIGSYEEFEITNLIELKKLDIGSIGGISYDLNPSLSFQLEINWGLRNIVEDYNPLFRRELKRKNRQLTLGLSYYFPSSIE